MKLLIYWLYAAIVSGIWFFWRYRIYENEFLIIDDALKDCVNWGKRNGYLLPEKPSYFQFFLVERPWNILILNRTKDVFPIAGRPPIIYKLPGDRP